MKYFLSIDCGLTKLKANIFTSDGFMVAEEQADTPLGNFLVNTAQLKKSLLELIHNILLKSKISPQHIKTISTSGHGNGVYFCGENGILEYGYSSMFADSAPYTPSTDEVFHITNQTSWSGQPLPILSFLKNQKNKDFKKIKKILFCKDVIKYFLTDRVVTDYTDASAGGLLNYKTCQYDKALLTYYDLGNDMHLLPDITYSTEIIGTVSEHFAAESGLTTKTKVLNGMFDVNACMLGSGVVTPEKYCIIGGTWGINSAVLKNCISSKRITQCCNFLFPNRYMCIDSAPTSCSNLEWFLKNVLKETDYKSADLIVQNQDFDEKLIYLPYVYSASDVNNSGTFIGLNANHTYKDMLRAVYEGIVFEHMRRIEKMKDAGIVFDTAVLTGGAANSNVMCQMFADVTGLKIQTVNQSQTGSLGGAIIGTVAEGIYSSVEEAVEKIVRYKNCYYPTENNPYASKYKLFKETIKYDK